MEIRQPSVPAPISLTHSDVLHVYDTKSDEALLEGLIAYGNENALALLYQRCGGILTRWP